MKDHAALWAQLEKLDDDLLDPGYPEELVDEELRELGFNPEEVAARGRELCASIKFARR